MAMETRNCQNGQKEKGVIDEVLQSSSPFLITLLDTIPNPVFFKDTDGVYQGCNKAFAEQILGLPKEKIVGCSLFDLSEVIPGELAAKYFRQDQALMQNQGTQFYESIVRCADGIERHFLFNKATFCDARGQVAGIVGVMLDITERKMAEDALKRSEERFRRLFEDAVLGIFQSNEKGKIISANPAIAKMFGYESSEELLADVGQNASRLYANSADRWQNIRRVIENDAPIQKETLYRRKDGTTFTGKFHAWKVNDDNDRLLYIEGFVEDITKRKQIEESLRESESRLRFLSSRLLSARESESRRISMEIHDTLGQNLAVLKLQIGSIAKGLRQDQGNLKEDCRKSLRIIDQTIESGRNLARNLSPSIIQDLKIGGTLRWMLDEFEAQNNIRTSLEMSDIDDLFSETDQIIIYRIFQEALRNIQKHADARHVSVLIRKEGQSIYFRIEDDGKGFDVDENWSRHVAERGLGLAALDERSRMLGGTLDICSRKGRGTRITLKVHVSTVGDFSR
jgi:PAS domain S-box-containing protein